MPFGDALAVADSALRSRGVRTRELISAAGLEVWLQVDGGVSLETIERCAAAGADVFVAGSAVFSAEDPDAMVELLRTAAGPA